MFKNKLFTFLFSLTLSFVLFIPTTLSLVSSDDIEISSLIDFSGEEEEQKSEIENLEIKTTFENDYKIFHFPMVPRKISFFNSMQYSSIDRELHLPPPERL